MDADAREGRVGLWALRGLWLVLPLAVGPALAAALDGRVRGVQVVGTVLAWGVWAAALVASLVPRSTSLTALRVAAPGAVAVAAWAAGPGSSDGDLAHGALAVVSATLAATAVAAPATIDAFVNGSAYGTERRFALRCPPVLGLLGALTWLVVAAGAVAGPLLLGAGRWAVGIGATALGAVAVGLGGRSLHGLARRWLVLVPSGVVVHDPVARPESVMAPRPHIAHLGPAVEGADAVDLTLGAPGLALVLETSEPLPVTVRAPGGDLETQTTTRVVVTPLRPAAVLAEAATRRLPVG